MPYLEKNNNDEYDPYTITEMTEFNRINYQRKSQRVQALFLDTKYENDVKKLQAIQRLRNKLDAKKKNK